jgi:hypothetical protein
LVHPDDSGSKNKKGVFLEYKYLCKDGGEKEIK